MREREREREGVMRRGNEREGERGEIEGGRGGGRE